jgi:hypothetical protein
MARSQPGQLVIGPTRASATRRKQNRISWIAATGARNGDGRGHLASDREFWHQADEADDVGAVEKLSERHDCKRLLCGVTVLRDASQGFAVSQFVAIQTVGPSLGVEVIPVNMRDAGEIEQSVANFARSPNGGLIPIPSAAAVGLTAVTSYPPTTPSFLDKQRSVKWFTHFRWQLLLGRVPEPGGVHGTATKPS